MSAVLPPDGSMQFWVQIDNNPTGPFDFVEIKQKLSSGELNHDTLLCTLGEKTWTPLSRLIAPDLNQAVAGAKQSESLRQKGAVVNTTPSTSHPSGSWSRLVLLGIACVCIFGAGVAIYLGRNTSSYNLSNRLMSKGGVIRTDTTTKIAGGSIAVNFDNQTVVGHLDLDGHSIVKLEVVQDAAGTPSRLKETTLVDVTKIQFTYPDTPTRKETINGLFQGHSVLAEKVDGIWQRRLVDGVPTPAQSRELLSEWTLEEIYPDRALSVGDSWTVTGPALRRLFAMNDTLSFQGSAAFKFIEVIRRNNDRTALIHAQMEIKATVIDDQNQESNVELALSGHIYRSLNSLIDVESKMVGHRRESATVIALGKTIKTTVNGVVTIHCVQERK